MVRKISEAWNRLAVASLVLMPELDFWGMACTIGGRLHSFTTCRCLAYAWPCKQVPEEKLLGPHLLRRFSRRLEATTSTCIARQSLQGQVAKPRSKLRPTTGSSLQPLECGPYDRWTADKCSVRMHEHIIPD